MDVEEQAWEVCRRVLAVKHVMMFNSIRYSFGAKEILEWYGVENIQELANGTYEMAEEVLTITGRLKR